MIYKQCIKVLKKEQNRQLELQEIRNQQKQKKLIFDKEIANLKLLALKSQLNSHFVFNVLTSIQYYILEKDVDSAIYYLNKFSKLIRIVLTQSHQKYITLEEELDYLKMYIEIENIRLEHSIDWQVEIDPTITPKLFRISPMLLQPFVENAVVHAFPPHIKNPVIKVKITAHQTGIAVTISDNGIGSHSKKSKKNTSMGIDLVKKRLSLLQGNRGGLKIQITPDGTIVHLIIFPITADYSIHNDNAIS